MSLRVVRNSSSFIMFQNGGIAMNIGTFIKENQPDSYKKLKNMKSENKNLTEKDIKELMHHSSYKRSRRGAIKQVR